VILPRQVPGLLAAEEKLKAAGVDEVIVYCINDAAVMDAWADDQKVGRDGQGSIINMLADPHGNLSDALSMRMDHTGPFGKFGQRRSKRFSALVVNGVFKIINVAEAFNDPAGDDKPDNSLVEKMLTDMAAKSEL
jgi:2-Cys peroxiredoxin 5